MEIRAETYTYIGGNLQTTNEPLYKFYSNLFDNEYIIGEGQYGRVYKGFDVKTNQSVAIKVIDMRKVKSQKVLKKIIKTIKMVFKVLKKKKIYNNLIQIYDFIQE